MQALFYLTCYLLALSVYNILSSLSRENVHGYMFFCKKLPKAHSKALYIQLAYPNLTCYYSNISYIDRSISIDSKV